MIRILYTVAVGVSLLLAVPAVYSFFQRLSQPLAQTFSAGAEPLFRDGHEPRCEICLYNLGISPHVTLNCHHGFHRECLSLVFDQIVTNMRACPICRESVPESFISAHNL